MPTANDYIKLMTENLVHASFKTVNSNAPPGGIRLGSEQAIDANYVCARTHMADQALPDEGRSLPLDYIANNNWFKPLRDCLGEKVDKPTPLELTDNEKKQVAQAYVQLAQGSSKAEFATGVVPMRLKQILLPKGDDYVATTPITATGHAIRVMDEVRRRTLARQEIAKDKALTTDEKRERLKDFRSIPCVEQFSVGGSNSQNVGARVFGAFTRPLVFDNVPTMSSQAKDAFRIAYKGINLRIPRQMVEAYRDFLEGLHQKAVKKGLSTISWTLELKTQEYKYLAAMWEALEKQAKKAARLLADQEQSLPDPLPCIEVNPAAEGWLQEHARTIAWRESQAKWFAERLSTYRLGTDQSGHPIIVGLDKPDIDRICNAMIKGGR